MHPLAYTCTSQLLDEDQLATNGQADLAASLPIMVAMLVRDHPCIPGFVFGALFIIFFRQFAQTCVKTAPRSDINLQGWRSLLRIIQRTYGDLYPAIKFITEWRAALGTKAARVVLGTGEIGWSLARPDNAVSFHQRTKKPAKSLLAHATVTEGREAKTFNAVAYSATLAAAG